jgi:hypothetical protein
VSRLSAPLRRMAFCKVSSSVIADPSIATVCRPLLLKGVVPKTAVLGGGGRGVALDVPRKKHVCHGPRQVW